MTGPVIRARAPALHDAPHARLDRRRFMAILVRLAGGVAAAQLLFATVAGDPAAAAVVPEDDPRLVMEYIAVPAGERQLGGYLVRQKEVVGRPPGVVVIHEDRGLTPHIRDIARRLALEGFVAFAPDMLSRLGGTPADADAARAMMAGLDSAGAVEDVADAVRWLAGERRSSGAVGIVGFCWGGATVNRAAAAMGPSLRAGVAYYGAAPPPSDAPMVAAPLLLHYAGLDERVNRSGTAWVEALQQTGKTVSAYFYPAADHGFANDTLGQLYDPAAARLAWDRTVAFLQAQLA